MLYRVTQFHAGLLLCTWYFSTRLVINEKTTIGEDKTSYRYLKWLNLEYNIYQSVSYTCLVFYGPFKLKIRYLCYDP